MMLIDFFKISKRKESKKGSSDEVIDIIDEGIIDRKCLRHGQQQQQLTYGCTGQAVTCFECLSFSSRDHLPVAFARILTNSMPSS